MTAPLTIEQRLRRLEDEHELRDLLAAYAFYADLPDREAWIELFTDDAEMDIQGLGTFSGKQSIREGFISRLPVPELTRRQHHHIHGVTRFAVEGDVASADGYTSVISKRENAPYAIELANLTRWRFRRVDGQWRIRSRTVRFLGTDEHDELLDAGFGHDVIIAGRSATKADARVNYADDPRSGT